MPPITKYTQKLNGSRVLIIGGTSGIGFGLADALLEFGAIVTISSSSPQRISTAIQRLRSIHPDVDENAIQGIPCNLGSLETLPLEVENLFTAIAKQGSKLSHIVFTAGDALAVRKLEDFTMQEILQAGTVRFFAPLVIAQHVRKYLTDGPASSYTISTGGIPEHILKNWAVMHSYLAGINGMVRGLAVDLAPIRVNAVGLGPVETEMWDAAKEQGAYDGIRDTFVARMATGRIGRVEDAVEAYLYVMRDGNASGSVVTSHGGHLLL